MTYGTLAGMKIQNATDFQRWAGLVLTWVTVLGYTISVFNQATQANSAWSSLHKRN